MSISRSSSPSLAPNLVLNPGTVDELIELIYQGPLEERPWQSFVSCLRRRTDCDVAALTVRPGKAGIVHFMVWETSAEKNQSEAKRYFEGARLRIRDADPLGKALSHPGDVLTLDDVIPRDKLVETEFYRDLMQPFGISYQMGMCFSEPSGWMCNIGLMNGPTRRNFGDKEKAFFRAFYPHLERALALYARIKLSETEKEIFQETLDRLTIGVYILDGRGKIIGTNKVGQYITRRASAIAITDDRIVLEDPGNSAQLTHIITQALAWREKDHAECFVDVLRAEAQDGTALNLVVRSVAQTEDHKNDASPSVIVYAEDSTSQKLPAERFIARLFGLSSSEAFLAILLANGFTLAEAAVKLDFTESTVRSYLKNVFAKTGVSRQADLVRLILKTVALVA